jgi:hypothetical protein
MAKISVEAETTRHTDTTARCSDCDWGRDDGKALTTYDGRNLRSRSRNHAEQTGHTVMVEVETHSGTFIRPKKVTR